MRSFAAYARPGLLVEPADVDPDDASTVVVDCSRPEMYHRAHITGSVHLGTSASVKSAKDSKVVMPAEEYEELMARLGISPTTRVICYDDHYNALMATRFWWSLQLHGHQRASVMSGGWSWWVSEGRPIESSPSPVASRPSQAFVSRPQSHYVALAADVMEAISQPPKDSPASKRRPQLLDVRTRLEYEGLDFRGNRRGGHIPSAIHLDYTALLSPDRPATFRSPEELEEIVDMAGLHRDKPVITVCQSGIRAATAMFALQLIGFDDVAVYDASMSEWLNDVELPLAHETRPTLDSEELDVE